jgi:hypothetical protein
MFIHQGQYAGDILLGAVVRFYFNTGSTASNTPITLAGVPVISVYKDGSTTPVTTGVLLTVDILTGRHRVTIDTGSDPAYYTAGSDFEAVITTGTVDGVSAVGVSVGRFSINNRTALRPTSPGRTLDVNANGEAGVDWANVGGQTTAVNLSGTSTKALEPTTAGRTLDITANGEAGIDWANIGNPTTAVNLSGTSTKALQPTTAGRTLDVTANGNAGIDWNNIDNPTATVGLSGTALAAVLGNVIGSVASVVANVNADVVKISGDATAADKLEAMLDGTGGVDLFLRSVSIIQNLNGSTALQITGSAPGTTGVSIEGQDMGLVIFGNDPAVLITGGGGDAVQLTSGGGNGDAIQLTPNGTGKGINGTLARCTLTDTTTTAVNVTNMPNVGNGAFTVTATVTDGAAPIQGALVRITSGINSFSNITDASGNAQFAADAGSYTVGVTKSGYQFTPETRTVTGSEAGTLTNDLEMTAIVTPTAPSDPDMCLIFGTMRDLRTNLLLRNVPVTVKRTDKGPIYAGGFLVGTQVGAITDENGFFSVQVPQSDVMDPPSTWRIICREAGIDTVQTLNGTTFDLASIV